MPKEAEEVLCSKSSDEIIISSHFLFPFIVDVEIILTIILDKPLFANK